MFPQLVSLVIIVCDGIRIEERFLRGAQCAMQIVTEDEVLRINKHTAYYQRSRVT